MEVNIPMAIQPQALVLSTGQRINWLMGIVGVKPGALAAKLGIDKASLWHYRRDLRPIPSGTLAGLADELNTTADFLLCRTDDPRPLEGVPGGDRPTREKVRGFVTGDFETPDLPMTVLSRPRALALQAA